MASSYLKLLLLLAAFALLSVAVRASEGLTFVASSKEVSEEVHDEVVKSEVDKYEAEVEENNKRRELKAGFNCDAVINYTVDDIQSMYFTKVLTPVKLVKCYLKRISMYSDPNTYDQSLTPYPLNAIIQLNPNIIAQAYTATYAVKKACKKAAGPPCLGPLFGIPVVLKDNVVADGMFATAGSYALLGCSHPQATLTTKIIAKGGLILAKAGLSEWANYRGQSVSGWSGRNGQVADPYVHYVRQNITVSPSPYPSIPSAIEPGLYVNALNPTIVSGSSSGSAVVAAVGLAAVTIGSETSGSILGPSSANALVGIKPTVGLVSRYGVVPLSHSQDTAGPICRTVRDAAILLDAVYGPDTFDEDTIAQIGLTPSGGYAQFAKGTPSLAGFKFAAAPLNPLSDAKILAAYSAALAAIQAAGAQVDIYTFNPAVLNNPLGNASVVTTSLILPTDFKQDIATYLAGCTWADGYDPLYTLADLIQFNKDNYLLEFQGGKCCRGLPAYGNFFQQTWESSVLTVGLYDPNYLAQKVAAAQVASLIQSFFNGSNPFNSTYDALIHQGGFIGTWATTRNPSITVPLTTNSLGAPGGIIFSGLPFSEAKLVQIAYGYEQLINQGHRPQPTFCDSYTCFP